MRSSGFPLLLVAAGIVALVLTQRPHPATTPILVASSTQTLSEFLASEPYLLANVAGFLVVIALLRRRGFFSARSLTVPRRDVGAHNPVIWFICGLIVWLSAGTTMGIVSGLLPSGGLLDSPGVQNQTIAYAAGYGAGLTVGILLAYLLHASAPACGLGVSFKSFFQGMLAMVVAWPVIACIGAAAVGAHLLTGGARPDPLAHATLQSLVQNPQNPWVLAQVLLAVIAAPIQEEIIYRGMLQSAILAATKRVWVSVGITSILFAAAHLSPGTGVPWYAAVALFGLSIAIGLTFERTGKLSVAIGMHIAFNLANVAMALLGSRS
ncbi:MAG: CPBP family intramembrane metalloprotease [Planctomycetota bacterium]|nr:CPBP family intramembrane metalloprotease [Planctomycetota bacterium]